MVARELHFVCVGVARFGLWGLISKIAQHFLSWRAFLGKYPLVFLSSPEYLVVKNRAVLGWIRVSFLFRPNYPLSCHRSFFLGGELVAREVLGCRCSQSGCQTIRRKLRLSPCRRNPPSRPPQHLPVHRARHFLTVFLYSVPTCVISGSNRHTCVPLGEGSVCRWAKVCVVAELISRNSLFVIRQRCSLHLHFHGLSGGDECACLFIEAVPKLRVDFVVFESNQC